MRSGSSTLPGTCSAPPIFVATTGRPSRDAITWLDPPPPPDEIFMFGYPHRPPVHSNGGESPAPPPNQPAPPLPAWHGPLPPDSQVYPRMLAVVNALPSPYGVLCGPPTPGPASPAPVPPGIATADPFKVQTAVGAVWCAPPPCGIC